MRYTVCVLLILALFGCGPGTPPKGNFPSLRPDALVDASGDVADSGPDTTVKGTMHPDGTWLFWNETPSCINALNTRIEGISWGLSLAWPVMLPDKRISWVIHGCRFSQAPLFGVKTVIPDHFAESSPDRIFDMTATPAPKGNACAQGTVLKQDAPSVQLWGVKMADPMHDPLPTSADDPRVWDMDGDGHPGGTIWAEGPNGKKICELWIVHRTVSQWTVTVKNAILLEGGGTNASEQNFVYASGGICASKSKVDFMDNLNRAVFLRIDGKDGAPNLDRNHDGKVTCDELRAADLGKWIKPSSPDDNKCNKK